MKLDFIVEKGILQIISEKIGNDAAKVYWNLVFNLEDIDFSHNKKYRLMQGLYRNGLLFKVKKEATFNYIPIPPSAILFNENLDEEVIKVLDKEYLERFFDTLVTAGGLIETNGKTLDGIVLFFVRNIMTKSCLTIFGGATVYELLNEKMGKKAENIKFLGIDGYFKKGDKFDRNLRLKARELIAEKRVVIIDDKYALVFFKILDNIYFGYITGDTEKVKEKTEEFNFLWKV